ncbi:MAG: hypothetical protein ACKVP0_08655 [Pirellulaceae bacterium]
MPNKPNARHTINVTPDKISHLLLRRKNNFPPVTANPANPVVGDIIAVAVADDDNEPLYFDATAVAQVNPKRLGLRLVSRLPPGGIDPLDGLLTITLIICKTTLPGPITTKEIPVAEAPVDYISDPGAP